MVRTSAAARRRSLWPLPGQAASAVRRGRPRPACVRPGHLPISERGPLPDCRSR